MDQRLPELVKLLADITTAERNIGQAMPHSATFLEIREQTLRHLHESCLQASMKLHVLLADTGMCIYLI